MSDCPQPRKIYRVLCAHCKKINDNFVLESHTCSWNSILLSGLQATDVNHDARISALEQNGGGSQNGNFSSTFRKREQLLNAQPYVSKVFTKENFLSASDTIALHSVLTSYSTIPIGSNATFLLVEFGEYGNFDMILNDDVICSAELDHNNNGASDSAQGSCSAVVDAVAGEAL